MAEAAWFQILDKEDQPSGLMIIGEVVESDGIDPAEIARDSIDARFKLRRIPPPRATPPAPEK